MVLGDALVHLLFPGVRWSRLLGDSFTVGWPGKLCFSWDLRGFKVWDMAGGV